MTTAIPSADPALQTGSFTAVQQVLRKSAPKADVQRWMEIQPSRAYRDLALGWLGALAGLGFAAWAQAWWGYAVAVLVVGCSQYALFILGHDAIHYALHPNRKVNDGLSRWLIHGPMFMGLADGRRNHLEHHKLLGSQSDPDRYLHSLGNKNSKLAFLLFCLGIATFGKTVLKVTPFGRLLESRADSGPAKPKGADAAPARLLGEYATQRLPVFVTQVLLVAGFLGVGLPLWAYPVLWVAPIYLFVFLPDEIRAFCDHAVPSLPDEAVDDKRLVTFRPNIVEAAIFSPHNMNLHAEHHLWPSVPYYNLPLVHERIGGRPEITVRRSYVAFLVEVFRSLPLERSSTNIR